MAAPPAAAVGAMLPQLFNLLLSPTNPHPHYAFNLLDQLTDFEIANLLFYHPHFAGYVVAVYGRNGRWEDNWLSLMSPAETEHWHRERDRQRQLRAQLRRLTARAAPVAGTPAAVPIAQRSIRVRMELIAIDRRILRQTLATVQLLQARYNRLGGLANPNPVQQQYQHWRAEIVQNLNDRILNIVIELARVASDLSALGPNPAAPLAARVRPPRFPQNIAQRNVESFPRLIETLVLENCVDALRMLRYLGVFTPISYARKGVTFLHVALGCNNNPICHYLLHEYMPHALWQLPYGTPALQHTNLPWTDLETLAHNGSTAWFQRAWTTIYPLVAAMGTIQGRHLFRRTTQEVLCTQISRSVAEQLAAAPLNLDLAQITPRASNRHLGIQTPTLWHFAVINPHVDFLEIVGSFARNHDDINLPAIDPAGLMETPLQQAVLAGREGSLAWTKAARLIQYGARIPRDDQSWITKQLPKSTDILWRACLWAPGTDLRSGHGTFDGGWLHDVVNGLVAELNAAAAAQGVTGKQRSARKQAAIGRAVQLIRAIRAGTPHSPPVDLGIQNSVFLTALQLAVLRGLPRRVLTELQ